MCWLPERAVLRILNSQIRVNENLSRSTSSQCRSLLFVGMLALGGALANHSAVAQDSPRLRPQAVAGAASEPKAVGSEQAVGSEKATDDQQRQRADKFAEYMSGASLKGRFTITGRGDKMPEETYTISKCEKLPEGNLYRFTARIQYGDTDTELPMDIPVEWAGDTPVISLTNMWLPGLGTFSARVLIYKNTYAGTWIHDDVGGQMFGVIVKENAEVKASSQEPVEVAPTGSNK